MMFWNVGANPIGQTCQGTTDRSDNSGRVCEVMERWNSAQIAHTRLQNPDLQSGSAGSMIRALWTLAWSSIPQVIHVAPVANLRIPADRPPSAPSPASPPLPDVCSAPNRKEWHSHVPPFGPGCLQVRLDSLLSPSTLN